MKNIIFTLCFISMNAFAQQWKTDEQYIQRFATYAVEEMEQYKIPASIKLAQGLLETGGGQSRLAQQGKNHFGIKCKEDWTGKTMRHTDDAPNECFRVYNDPKESYRDHSLFLAHRKYYTNLFKLDINDYKAWAHGLKKAGYATNPRYAYILIDKIEKYKLYEFDKLSRNTVQGKLLELYPGLQLDEDDPKIAAVSQKRAVSQKAAVPEPQPKTQKKEKTISGETLLNQVAINNHPNARLKYFVLPSDGITVAQISKRFGVSQEDLMKFNDFEKTELDKNQIVFLDAKKTFGRQKNYKAGKDETMHGISQKFAIKLRNLYANNRMKKGDEPKEGEIIYINGKRPR